MVEGTLSLDRSYPSYLSDQRTARSDGCPDPPTYGWTATRDPHACTHADGFP